MKDVERAVEAFYRAAEGATDDEVRRKGERARAGYVNRRPAASYDREMRKLVPFQREMQRALAFALPFDRGEPIRVLDLGAGTGNLSRVVSEIFPRAQLTLLDVSSEMIELARKKVRGASFVIADFTDHSFEGEYDAIVSCQALHHVVTDEGKKRLFGRIYASLRPGGVFYSADGVLGASPYLDKVYLSHWLRTLRKHFSSRFLEEHFLPKLLSEEQPSRLTDQLAWLAQAGFTDIDVIWKSYFFAVYGGCRPDGGRPAMVGGSTFDQNGSRG